MKTLKFVKTIRIGGPAKYEWRNFLSWQPFREGMVGLVRDFSPLDPEQSVLTGLSFDGKDFSIKDTTPFGSGEDPRVFKHQNEVYALSWVYEEGRRDWDIFLIDVLRQGFGPLKIDGYHGKNWTAVSIKDRIYILRSLDPLVVYYLNRKGELEPWHGDPDRKIGLARGGSNALLLDDKICGFGHVTVDADNHRPFYYEGTLTNLNFKDVKVLGLDPCFKILDPTCFYELAGKQYVVLCCTERAWLTSKQRFCQALMEVTDDTPD